MKHLLAGAAVIAALAFSAPVGAQQANPSGGNPVGVRGPYPGGPGLEPHNPSPPPAAAAPAGAPAAPAPGPRATGSNYVPPPPSGTDETTSATPPMHRHARTSGHHRMASHHPSRFPRMRGDAVANQLNQAELTRLQAGNFTPPGPTEMGTSPEMSGPPGEQSPDVRGVNRMSTGGRGTSTRYGR